MDKDVGLRNLQNSFLTCLKMLRVMPRYCPPFGTLCHIPLPRLLHCWFIWSRWKVSMWKPFSYLTFKLIRHRSRDAALTVLMEESTVCLILFYFFCFFHIIICSKFLFFVFSVSLLCCWYYFSSLILTRICYLYWQPTCHHHAISSWPCPRRKSRLKRR